MNKKYFSLTLILCFIFALFFIKFGESGDLALWRTWAVAMFEKGFTQIYAATYVDYVPVFLYFIWVFISFQSNLASVKANTFQLKAFFWLFDVLGVYFAGKWLQKKGFNPFLTLIILLNIAYWYNSIIWGQLDGVYMTMILGSLLLTFEKRTILSIFIFVIAFNTKIQAIVFLPILGMLWLPQLIENKQNIWKTVAMIVATEFLIFAPFIFSGNLDLALAVFKSAVGRYPYLSDNAYNWWYFLMTQTQVGLYDTFQFLHLPLRAWGLLAFFISSGFTLLLLGSRVWAMTLKKQTFQLPDFKLIFLVFAIIPTYFFFFNTEMHERYMHPAVIFCGIYAILNKDYWLYALLSAAYMQNISGFLGKKIIPIFLENHQLSAFKIIWNPTLVAAEFTILIIFMNFRLLSLSNFKQEFRSIKTIISQK